jgi:hypothetical protein
MRDKSNSQHDNKSNTEIRKPNGGSSSESADLHRYQAELEAEAETQPDNSTASWPEPLAEKAYQGLAGEVVRAIEPHSESDPAALLLQFLVMFGNMIGRNAHFIAEADKHYTNLDVCLVGRTSKARKGSSYGRLRDLMESVDGEWVGGRVLSGLSSGEGLIHQVRDPVTKHEALRDQDKKVTGYQDVVVDSGAKDKRLLVFESEFALVLRVMARETNTLTAILRQAWDTGTLRTMPKNPTVATGAHISIVGHITVEELRRYITVTELASGFANRFLWMCVSRSKCLPRGGKQLDVKTEAKLVG